MITPISPQLTVDELYEILSKVDEYDQVTRKGENTIKLKYKKTKYTITKEKDGYHVQFVSDPFNLFWCLLFVSFGVYLYLVKKLTYEPLLGYVIPVFFAALFTAGVIFFTYHFILDIFKLNKRGDKWNDFVFSLLLNTPNKK